MAATQNDYITRKDLETFGEDLSKRIVDDISEVIDQLAHNMHTELQSVRREVADLRASVESIANTLDHFLKRLDDVEKDNVARDAQYARLLAWAEKVAEVTGVKLEY